MHLWKNSRNFELFFAARFLSIQEICEMWKFEKSSLGLSQKIPRFFLEKNSQKMERMGNVFICLHRRVGLGSSFDRQLNLSNFDGFYCHWIPVVSTIFIPFFHNSLMPEICCDLRFLRKFSIRLK